MRRLLGGLAAAVLQLFPALLLHRLWKLRWYHGLLLLMLIARQAWYASPYFMLALYGEPDPSRYQIETGTVRIEGKLERTGSGPQGWKPPRYFLDTSHGPIEFHCGYLPRRIECYQFFQNYPIAGQVISLANDPYFGIVYLKLPDFLIQKGWSNEREMAERITKGWKFWLRLHEADLYGLIAATALYVVLLLAAITVRVRKLSLN